MLLFRAIDQKYITDPFNAIGAERHGGRWNSVGSAVLYTSESFELALSEKLYGSQLISIVKNRHTSQDVKAVIVELIQAWRVVHIEADTSEHPLFFTELPVSVLPGTWKDKDPTETKLIGDQFINDQAQIALRVPSVIYGNQGSGNWLVNPNHPEFSSIVHEKKIEAIDCDTKLIDQMSAMLEAAV